MKTLLHTASVGALLGAGAMLASTPAFAQASAASEIEEVVVTARRVEENIQDVPVAVTAISGEKLNELVVNNVQDLNKLAPGLQNAGCSGTRDSCAPVIRGQGNAFATNRPSVVTYFAEVPNFQPSYYDLQSIQVVAGPQGTLFGETATGGVILYSPKKPGNEFGGYVSGQAGNYHYKSLEAAVGGAVIPDKVMVRGALEYRKRKGFTTAIPSFGGSPTDFDNVNRLQWRLSLVLKPFENLENYTVYAGSVDKIHGNSSPIYFADPRYMNPGVRNLVPSAIPSFVAQWLLQGGTTPAPGRTFGQLITDALARQVAAGPRTTFYNYDRHRTSKFNGVVNTTTWDVSDNLTVKNIFGMSWTKAKGPTIDVDGTDQLIVDTRAVWVPGTTSMATGEYSYTGGWPARQWTDEVQLLGKLFEDRLEWQAGYYYRYDASREWLAQQGIISVFSTPQGDPAPATFCTTALPGQTPVPLCSQIGRRKDISYAGFGQATFAVTPDVHITGGYRRTWDERRADVTAAPVYRVAVNGVLIAIPIDGRDPLPGAAVITTLVPKSHQDTYTITGDWRINEQVLVYAAHRTGYKGGGINANATPSQPERTFGPEKLSDIELGAKTNWTFGGVRGRFNIAVYRDKYRDIQRSQILAGTATTITTNLADAKLKGVELDATISPTPWLRISGNFSYLDAKYTDYSETKPCSTQYWRPQCVGLLATDPVFIDHANGVIRVGGQTINFTPDAFQDAAKYKWAFQPTILLKEWTGEDISFGANVYHLSSFSANASNRSEVAGVPPLTLQTILGTASEPFFRKGYTIVDLRANWRNIKGSPVSAAVSVTNVGNKLINASNAGGFTIGGTAPAILGEPRMWYAELKYEFGAK